MDRVVLRAPKFDSSAADETASRCSILSLSAAVAFAALNHGNGKIAISFLPSDAAAFVIGSLNRIQNETSHYHISTTVASIIISLIIIVVCFFILVSLYKRLFLRRREFIEAAVEITPLGIQLVSVYGRRRKNANATTNNDPTAAESSTSCQSYYHISSSQSDCTTCYYKNHIDIEYKVRAFIPRQHILDVIVMEVVWPHCVWSQLVFRVAKEEAHHVSKKHSINELLKQNQVSIVPTFPEEECRGMLSYEQCLIMQAEIEKLHGLSCR